MSNGNAETFMRVLITEYPIWRQLSMAKGRAAAAELQMVIVTEAP
jgi:hypothetical protein